MSGRIRKGTVLSVHNEGTVIQLRIKDDEGVMVVAAGDHRPMRYALERLSEEGDIIGMKVQFALAEYGALLVLGPDGQIPEEGEEPPPQPRGWPRDLGRYVPGGR